MPTVLSLKPSPALALAAEQFLRRLAESVRRAHDAWQRRRAERATVEALHALDARLLRDIGLDHSELSSVAAELHGGALPDRRRVLHDPLAGGSFR